MILNFEVNNQIMKKCDTNEDIDLLNYNYNQYCCNFSFNTDENSLWNEIDKFAIFTDGWNNTSIVHLGTENSVNCFVPKDVLRGTFFKVSVYGGDLISTNNVFIPLQMSGYVDYNPFNQNGSNINLNNKKDIFVEIFTNLDTKVDNIIYDEHSLHLFNGEKLIESVFLPFIVEEDIIELTEEFVKSYIENGEIPIVTSDMDGLMSVSDKIKLDNLSNVASTGDYNDLSNIPNEFEPSPHTHTSEDIEDLEENTSIEIKRAYNFLVNQIRRYGE